MEPLKTRPTVNTFTQSPSLKQILAYILFLLMVVAFSIAVPVEVSERAWLISLLLTFYLSTISVIITTTICSWLDPSDPTISSNNRTDFFCIQCDGFVQQKSKHCKSCKRCVHNFDHHCKWINNCIGQKNYRWFIAMVMAKNIMTIIYMIGCVYLATVPILSARTVVLWVVGLLAFVMWIFIINLLIFHVVLYHKGISTYQCMTNSKVQNQPACKPPQTKEQLGSQNDQQPPYQNSQQEIHLKRHKGALPTGIIDNSNLNIQL